MEINSTKLRTFSMLGQRGVLGTALLDAAKDNADIIALSADLCNTSGLDRFRQEFPERFINVGIAEQNMVGIAAGIAAGGNIPFATTFANFAALRSCEQVRHFMGYMQENVKLVGMASGFAMGMFGTTHYSIEDIAAVRAVNHLVILSPADGLETYKAVMAAAAYKGPVYLRLSGGMNNPVVYKEDYDFQIGKVVYLKEGGDIAVAATGSMVAPALQAAARLEQDGIMAAVINIHTIKPLDDDAVNRLCGYSQIVTVEEHSKTGGLGSAVAEALAVKEQRPQQLFIGTCEKYLHAGDYGYMLEQHGLTAEQIYNQIKKFYKGENKND